MDKLVKVINNSDRFKFENVAKVLNDALTNRKKIMTKYILQLNYHYEEPVIKTFESDQTPEEIYEYMESVFKGKLYDQRIDNTTLVFGNFTLESYDACGYEFSTLDEWVELNKMKLIAE